MNNNGLILVPVQSENWREIIDLKVNKSQENFIEPNEISLLEAAYDKKHDWKCFGLYLDGLAVGFVMVGALKERYIWLDRFMIDRKFQGRGLGKEALELVKEHISHTYEVEEIVISILKENQRAKKFYQFNGFKDTGIVDSDNGEELFVYAFDGKW
ncbi:Spermine/spermidine acetyltransferase [Bacillus sp. THAF10]|uniref:GNAT family N-acetyltransferase n=1 Tax=Bacillus sp. THAF10 TaxID=2587848 RepID=UPI001267D0AD|nr:GNAT family N-acetyltransferase [Bacillus sp. THAF10]QFT90746.1 Spermine/spermidine acetyltransferase [Bacillus sp. THAF10]